VIDKRREESDLGSPGSAPAVDPIRVAAISEHPLTLLGICRLIYEEPGFELVAHGSARDGVLDVVGRGEPDVAIFDLELPSVESLEFLERVRSMGTRTRLVALTSSINQEQFIRARECGVRGVVLKTMPPHLLLQCLRTVHSGQEFLEKNVFLETFAALLERASAQLPSTLTVREQTIMDLIASGMSNRTIAEKLDVSEGTVKTHVHRIYEKLGLHSRYELMALAGKKNPR